MEILGKLKDALSKRIADVPTIKATMLGPRAVGKTSIMASIFSDARDQIAGTSLYFRPNGETGTTLVNKKRQLMDVIEKKKSCDDKPNTGAIEASNAVAPFEFEMGILRREKSVNIVITDYPGEYLATQPNVVSDFISESHIVMVAIDTPYLMEEGGRYNEEKNEVNNVISFFTRHSEAIRNKMILFVPLKCELYFHQNRIDEVASAVKQVYADLIAFCEKNNIACAVTPIQTLGGVEFDKFIENTNPLSTLKKLSTYKFYGDNPKYAPMFCVQPLYYLLTYVANFYEWSKTQDSGIWKKIKGSLLSILKDDDDFLHEIKKLSSKAITDEMGYSILVCNTILNMK